jgi:hypothetical protein
LPTRADVKVSRNPQADAKRIAWWEAEIGRAKDRKRPRTTIIEACRRHYRGEHHGQNSKQAMPGNADQHTKRPRVAIDQIFSTTEQCVALMTDQRPGVTAYPREPAAIERCELVSARLDYDQDQASLQTKAPLLARTMFVEGLAVARPSWDYAKDWPYGGPDLSIIPWESIFFDPAGRDWHNRSDFRWIAEEEWLPLWRIRSDWPEASQGMADENAGGLRQRISQTATTILDRITGHEGQGQAAERGPGAYVYRIWHLDIPEGEELADWVPPTGPGGVKMPPKMRYLVFGAGRVLEDKFWGSKFPHACFPNYIGTDPDLDYWPMGDVEFLIGPNRILNVLVSRAKAWAQLVPRSTMVYDSDHVNVDSLANLEAITIGVRGGQGLDSIIKWVPGADLGPGFFRLWEFTLQAFEQTSGLREVLMGRAPEAGNSGVAFERLQTFALARVREKMQNFNAGLVTLGYGFLEQDARHILEPRPLRVPGQTQVQGLDGRPRSMPFSFVDIGPDLYYTPLRPGDTLQPDPETNIVMSVPSPETVSAAIAGGAEPPVGEPAPTIAFEICLGATSLAGSRQDKREDVKALVGLGRSIGKPLIDDKAIYDAFDYAGGQEIQGRMQQAAQAQAQSQAQAQANAATQAEARTQTEITASETAHARQLQRDGAQIEGRLAQAMVRRATRRGPA